MKTWVDLWDRREHPGVLVAIRLLVATVVLWDFLSLWQLDLVEGVFGAAEAGGIGNPAGRTKVAPLYKWFPPTVATVWGIYVTVIVSAAMLWLGAGTRLAALVLLVAWSQLALVLPPSDRGIDMLLRNALFVLALSGCGKAWSVDARLRTGRWRGDGQPVTAWPRMLFVAQLLLVYTTAGWQKVGLSWTPMEGYSALYTVLRDPTFQGVSVGLLDRFYWATQAATATTWFWEWSTPLAAYAWWSRATRFRPGRLRGCLNRVNFWGKWVVIGAAFHLGTAGMMRLEVFAFGTLALYPAFFHPDEWAAWWRRLSGRWRSGSHQMAGRTRTRESGPDRPPRSTALPPPS
jgi:hypothetical protein